MLDSMPLPFQAILWPLIGAGLVLALNRWLPGWARRLVPPAAAMASLVTLWALKGGIVERAEIVWKPLNLFRMSLTFTPDGLSLLIGIVLAGAAAAIALGIRGQQPEKTVWHGLILLVLAGCLVLIMAANFLSLAVGSALIDLALIFLVVRSSSREQGQRLSLSLVVPGVASTLLIFLSALQMDTELGHASLFSQNLSEGPLMVLGVAGALRTLTFPLHARQVQLPETAAALVLPVAAGGYLLARVQALAPVLSDRPAAMAFAIIGLLVGGLLTWSGSARASSRFREDPVPEKWWIGVLVYQAGYLLSFVLLLAGATPWPIVSMVLVLAVLIIWWDTALDAQVPSSRGMEWFSAQVRPRWNRLRASTVDRLPMPYWWRAAQPGRLAITFLPATALASLAGMPLTLGARGRWPHYAAWLKRGDPSLLLVLAADTLLVAGLWPALAASWEQSREYRPRPAALLAMIGLTVSTVLLGLAPGILSGGLGLKAVDTAEVSVWGLGLLYMLPWLLGVWLARFKGLQQRHLARIWDAASLNWFYRGAGWAGERLVDILRWLSKVGEGEGWWGWALIVLALGVILFTMR
jgi:hypothetical protein